MTVSKYSRKVVVMTRRDSSLINQLIHEYFPWRILQAFQTQLTLYRTSKICSSPVSYFSEWFNLALSSSTPSSSLYPLSSLVIVLLNISRICPLLLMLVGYFLDS